MSRNDGGEGNNGIRHQVKTALAVVLALASLVAGFMGMGLGVVLVLVCAAVALLSSQGRG